MGIGMSELMVILLIVLVIFGAKKLPEIGSGLGKAISNFKRSTQEPEEIDVTPKDKPVEKVEKPMEKPMEKKDEEPKA